MPTPVILANGSQPPPLGSPNNGAFALNASVPMSLQSTSSVLSILWTLTKKPTGSTAAFDAPTSLTPHLLPLDVVGTYVFTAAVTYGSGVVTVQAAITVLTARRKIRLAATTEGRAFDTNAGTVVWDPTDGWGSALDALATKVDQGDAFVTDHGADASGLSDATAAIQAAHAAAGDVKYPTGTFRIAASATIGAAGKTHHFERGAMLKPDAGQTVTIAGTVDAATDQQVFDLSAGGHVSLPNHTLVHTAWFGAQGDGSTDDTIANQAAHDALPSAGGVVHVRGNSLTGALTHTKPIHMKLNHGGGLVAKSGTSAIITTTANLLITGVEEGGCAFTGTSGGVHIKISEPWTTPPSPGVFPNLGRAVIKIEHVQFVGGTRGFDTEGASSSGPIEGLIHLSKCLFTNQTDYSVWFDTSINNGKVEDCQFNTNFGSVRCKDNTETKFARNVHNAGDVTTHAAAATTTATSTSVTMSGLTTADIGASMRIAGAGAGGLDLQAIIVNVSGSTVTLDTAAGTSVTSHDVFTARPCYLLEGCHHVEIDHDELAQVGTSMAPEIRIMATSDGQNGIVTVRDLKFAAEHDRWLRSRPRIELYNPANPLYAAMIVKINDCRVYQQEFLLALTSIGRLANVATATVRCIHPFGHGLQVGDVFRVVQVSDVSFNTPAKATVSGIGAVTGPTGGFYFQTVSWSSTGSTVDPPMNLGGDIAAADTSAIALKSPARHLSLHGNTFIGFDNVFDDTMAVSDDPRAADSYVDYGPSNHAHGPLGLPCVISRLGFGRGFTRLHAQAHQPDQRIDDRPREVETTHIHNRVVYSEDNSHWTASSGMSFSNVADPFGGSTATRITRAGTNFAYTNQPEDCARIAFDNTSLAAGGYIKLWVKSNTCDSLWIAVIDSITQLIMPGSGRIVAATSTWRQIKIPFSVNPGHGPTLYLYLTPGGQDAVAGAVDVARVQISDVDCDYTPTAGASVDLTTTGTHFQRVLGVDTIAPGLGNASIVLQTQGGAQFGQLGKRSGDWLGIGPNLPGSGNLRGDRDFGAIILNSARSGTLNLASCDGGDQMFFGDPLATVRVRGVAVTISGGTVQYVSVDDTNGTRITDHSATPVLQVDRNGQFAAFNGTPHGKQTIAGMLSAVIDANAKALFTSIIAAQVNYGWWTDGTL